MARSRSEAAIDKSERGVGECKLWFGIGSSSTSAPHTLIGRGLGGSIPPFGRDSGRGCAAAGGSQTIFGARDAGFEIFQAGDVFGFFELAGVDAEVAVGGFQNTFEVIEAEAGIGGESAYDAKADALVN